MREPELLAAIVLVACGSRTELDTPRAPASGHAVSFEEFGDDVVLSVNATPASGFTWDFWFNAAKVPASSSIGLKAGETMIAAADSAGCEDIYVGFGSEFSPANRLAFVVDGLGDCAHRDTTPIDFAPPDGFVTDRWYFVAVSHDYASGQSRLYLDGALVAQKTDAVAPIPRVLPVTVGRWWDRIDLQYAFNEFAGAIDELHIYARALSDAEVASDHACGAASDMLAGYHFDEGTGTTAGDFAGGSVGLLEHDPKWVAGSSCAP